MRKGSLILLVLLFLCLVSPLAEASGEPDFLTQSLGAQLDALDLGDLLHFADRLEEEIQAYLPRLNLADFSAKSVTQAQPGDFLALLWRLFFRELRLSLHLLRQFIVIGILAALLERLNSSFGSEGVTNLAFSVCFLVLVLLGLQSFQSVASLATNTVQEMVEFMQSLIPILSSLLLAVGAFSSATIFHPMLFSLVVSVASLVKSLILPLILFSTVLSLVSNFSAQVPFSKLGDLLRQTVVSLLGLLFLVFSGFMVVRGAIAPITDGVSLRTAKYLTKTLIPVAGGMFADSLEMVVGSSLLIKNGVGVFGLVMIVLVVSVPLLKVWTMILVYKLVGVLLEPICDSRLLRALSTLEASLTLVFISLGTVAVMFLLGITILVGVGNLTVLMR